MGHENNYDPNIGQPFVERLLVWVNSDQKEKWIELLSDIKVTNK